MSYCHFKPVILRLTSALGKARRVVTMEIVPERGKKKKRGIDQQSEALAKIGTRRLAFKPQKKRHLIWQKSTFHSCLVLWPCSGFVTWCTYQCFWWENVTFFFVKTQFIASQTHDGLRDGAFWSGQLWSQSKMKVSRQIHWLKSRFTTAMALSKLAEIFYWTHVVRQL